MEECGVILESSETATGGCGWKNAAVITAEKSHRHTTPIDLARRCSARARAARQPALQRQLALGQVRARQSRRGRLERGRAAGRRPRRHPGLCVRRPSVAWFRATMSAGATIHLIWWREKKDATASTCAILMVDLDWSPRPCLRRLGATTAGASRRRPDQAGMDAEVKRCVDSRTATQWFEIEIKELPGWLGKSVDPESECGKQDEGSRGSPTNPSALPKRRRWAVCNRR